MRRDAKVMAPRISNTASARPGSTLRGHVAVPRGTVGLALGVVESGEAACFGERKLPRQNARLLRSVGFEQNRLGLHVAALRREALAERALRLS